MSEGLILKGVGGLYHVESEGRVIECRAGGRLRLGDMVPCAGDRVTVEPNGEEGFITSILPRRNFLTRPPVANIDILFIVASEAPPETDTYLIDRQTVVSYFRDITPIVLLNKSDIASNDRLFGIYKAAGIPVYKVSALTGQGLDRVRELAKGKICAFSGNSAVGKSSLLNALLPGAGLEVGGLSRKISRGKNTTRRVELLPFPDGGYAADTPGFSSFVNTPLERIGKDRLQFFFPEIEPHFGRCRFMNCSHLKEQGCVIRQMEKEGLIPESRMKSYEMLHAELSQYKDWEEK